MSGFTATWSRARATFGSGAPVDATSLRDNEVALAQTLAEAAAPGRDWRGIAADAYAEAHRGQLAALSRLPALDAAMSDGIATSADVVIAGRRDLDEVMDWVLAVDAATPADDVGDRIRGALASWGIEQVATIVVRASDELAAIGSRIRDLGADYGDLTGAAEPGRVR